MKTQIRICLTVEFKANFLIFRSGATRRTPLVLARPGFRRKRRRSLQQLDDNQRGKVLMLDGLAQSPQQACLSQVVRFYSRLEDSGAKRGISL